MSLSNPGLEVGDRFNKIPPEGMPDRKTDPAANQPKDKFKRNREIIE